MEEAKSDKLDKLSTGLTSLFYQIDSEDEFVAAISDTIPKSDLARLLFRSMSNVYQFEADRRGEGLTESNDSLNS